MNKEQKNTEQKVRLMKFDCEMRAKSVELASSLRSTKDTKSLLESSKKIAKYIFGIAQAPKEEK